jgi:hypothetical protein
MIDGFKNIFFSLFLGDRFEMVKEILSVLNSIISLLNMFFFFSIHMNNLIIHMLNSYLIT